MLETFFSSAPKTLENKLDCLFLSLVKCKTEAYPDYSPKGVPLCWLARDEYCILFFPIYFNKEKSTALKHSVKAVRQYFAIDMGENKLERFPLASFSG
jgi:hypothetical protein